MQAGFRRDDAEKKKKRDGGEQKDENLRRQGTLDRPGRWALQGTGGARLGTRLQ